MTTIQPEMKVSYKAAPSTVGWVIEVSGDNARVFLDGSIRLVPINEIQPADELREMSPSDFKVALTRRRLEHPMTDQFLSYGASKTRLMYHQFLPVKKMLESPDQRLLIADEVGTGKTIEAGLIWAELESRAAHGLENVWIVCPKSLVGKWQEEMLQRFDLRLETISSEGIRQAVVALERDGTLPPRFSKCIVNLELIRMEEYMARLVESSVAWDLTIFDEAHHLRNTDTLSFSLAQFICERSKSAVFLTATPLQTHLQDIVHLMEALGVDVAADPDLLEEQLRWDMQLNDWIRLVRRQPPGWNTLVDNYLHSLQANGGAERPGWNGFRQLVDRSNLENRTQRTIAVDAARDLQVLSPYMTRTLRSDVDEDRPMREAITRTVEFTEAEAAFYEEVYRVCLVRASESGTPPGFATQMPERRTASCVPAVALEILKYATENEDEEHQARFTPTEVNILEPFARAALDSPDRKLDALNEILSLAFGELNADKVMIFSTFRGTLQYLAENLGERGYSFQEMSGLTPARDEDCRHGEKSRDRIASEFRQGKFQILLASEVAGEGLDFEHCKVVINYDLPWNPMRVEQRIGRCDRIGQASDKVYVGSLASVGTIEQRILSRLYERLRIFERALGEMEDVLGESIANFERDMFTQGLSRAQQEERLERIAQAIENNEQHKESIERSSVISTQGRQLIDSEQQEIKEAEARFLSPEELAEFTYTAIERHIPNSMRQTRVECEFDVITNDNIQDALGGLLRAYPATHSARAEMVRFRNRLSKARRTRVSFSGEREEAEFVHVRHPLLLLARHLHKEPIDEAPQCVAVIPADVLSNPTAVVWAVGSIEGYANRAELLCVTVDCIFGDVSLIPVERGQELMRVMSDAEEIEFNDSINIDAVNSRAEQLLLSEFADITDTFRLRDQLLTGKAKQAVLSHAHRQTERNERQLLKDNLNPRLRTMYNGWNRRIQDEAQSKIAEIERRSGVRSSLEVIGVALLYPMDDL